MTLNLPEEKICNAYINGVNANELSKIYNCNISTIITRLQNNNIKIRSVKLDLPENEICKKYINGMNCVELSKEYGCYYGTIIDKIRNNNIELWSMAVIKTMKLPEKEICDKYLIGINITELGIEYKCSETPIRRILRDNNIKIRSMSEVKMGRKVSEEARRHLSATKQGISYDKWESYACDQPYCPNFNEKCRESNRDKYDRKCFLTGLPEEENITSTDKIRKLSVHHVDMDKGQGCNGIRWKLVPLCMGWHSKVHNKLWEARIIWLLDNVWND